MSTEPAPEQEEVYKPLGLMWADFSKEKLEEFYALEEEEDEQIRMLSSLMEVQHYEDNPRSMIMVDFFYYNLHFARMRGLSLDATSALFSILKMVFEAAFGKDRAQDIVTAEEAYAVFKAKMMQHCVDNPAGEQILAFTLEETSDIVDYISKTFFRHYKAYQWVFTRPQPMLKVHRYLTVETPLPPLPLADAMVPSDAKQAAELKQTKRSGDEVAVEEGDKEADSVTGSGSGTVVDSAGSLDGKSTVESDASPAPAGE